jgi:superfamily I DNA/RNA helicase
MQKGGPGKKAGERCLDAYHKATSGKFNHEQVFEGFPLTNHGENRIAHCRKYDLTGFARLITAYTNNVCIFLFAGDHDSSDTWLEKNKGLSIVAKTDGKTVRCNTAYVSAPAVGGHGLITSNSDFLSNGPVIDLLNKSYQDKIFANLSQDVVSDIRTVESHTDENTILEAVERIKDIVQSDAILDVLLALRSSDKIKAKNRIDRFCGESKPIDELTTEEVKNIASSETIVRVQDVDPVLFEHFVRTADFKEWMLYLHPAQREIVDRDFNGPARLAGVSGSGKTCVVIHRAVRLAKADPSKRVLVLTLNDALSTLIQELIQAQCGATLPANITIKSIFQLCYDKLLELEPKKADSYRRRTVQKNKYAASEHIDEIWDEYYHCRNNNRDAEKMFDVVRTLLVRSVSPKDYLRQELDYIRSALSPKERNKYLDMVRSGRVVPLDARYRRAILDGLTGWEEKMAAIGAIDDLGIVTALYRHLNALVPDYHHILVDEVQDLGTLELHIIRKIAYAGSNDLFMCGDAAQSVQTKHAEMKAAEIDLPPARSISLKQNYRNSSQILTAAHTVLTKSFEKIPAGTVDLEILTPELANFTSPLPALLKTTSLADEFSQALAYAEEVIKSTSGKKACIAFCGYTQKAVEELGREVSLPVLCDTTNISIGHLFLSDLEQTKGFEFDLMIILNCSSGVIPHPQLPAQEWFRDLCKLYVALTRAKTELIVSFSGNESIFLTESMTCFSSGTWRDYELTGKSLVNIKWPAPFIAELGNLDDWNVAGKDFLKLRDAVGLSVAAQDAILKTVSGTQKLQRRAGGRQKQTEWKTFNEFLAAVQIPQNAVSIISEEVLEELNFRYQRNAIGLTSSKDKLDVKPLKTLQENQNINITPDIYSPIENMALKINSIFVYKHINIATYSSDSESANMLAVLCVAQACSAVSDLTVVKIMNKNLIGYLVKDETLNLWLNSNWLQIIKNSNNKLVLTDLGLRECLWRIKDDLENTALKKKGRKKLIVTPQRVEAFRQTILTGANTSSLRNHFSKQGFIL